MKLNIENRQPPTKKQLQNGTHQIYTHSHQEEHFTRFSKTHHTKYENKENPTKSDNLTP